jgi:hypothetical protein
MRRAVVNVATGPHYRKGQARLARILDFDSDVLDIGTDLLLWDDLPHADGGDNTPVYQIPPEWPSHSAKPYAFKAYALQAAANRGYDLLLWMDAAVKPVQSLEPLWERIERDGYWFAENAWNNYEWTADSAYPALFPDWFGDNVSLGMEAARRVNRTVPHVIACCFGLNLRSEIGATFLSEYYRLASETNAFMGPWSNRNYTGNVLRQSAARTAPCGPPDVIGHRHDQTAASVIAWRLGMQLTPGHRAKDGDVLAYPCWFDGGKVPSNVMLVHDGSME